MKIIGMAGRKQVGKSSFSMIAKLILSTQDQCPVLETAFATPLKKVCKDLFKLQDENVNGTDAEKDCAVGTWAMINEKIRNKYNKTAEDKISGREILQIVGTDLFRENLKDTLWADICIENIQNFEKSFYGNNSATMGKTYTPSPYKLCLITDVRFLNEIEAIKAVGGKVVRMYRDTGCKDSIVHKSETELEKIPLEKFDYIINEEKNKNIATLTGAVAEILFAEGLYNYDFIKQKNREYNGKIL